METFTMSRKEAPRPGLLKAALAGRMTNLEGASALGISVRQFQRLKQRFRAKGIGSVPHALRGRPSNRRVPAALAAQIATLIRTTYERFNDVHLTEKLREVHGLPVSRASVRRVRLALGLPAQRPRRAPPHRSRRPRAEAVGRLVQLDGSPFAWLEDRAPTLTLLGAIDDASSQVLALWFRPHEDLHGYTTLLEHLCRTHGLPLALYGDRLNVFTRNDRHWSLDEQLAGTQTPTHFGRILADLGIAFIAAHSPQAKGRIERLWGTLQDRLVSELRLRRVRTLEAANAFLPDFIVDHNRRFATPMTALPSVWRPAPRDLHRVLSCRYTRLVARDNTVTLGPRVVQLPPRARGRSWAGRRLDVRELLDGRLLVLADGGVVAQQAAPTDFRFAPRYAPHRERRPASPATPRPTPNRSLVAPAPPRSSLKSKWHPAKTHPWLTSLRRHVALKELRQTQRPARG
jgi:transposase